MSQDSNLGVYILVGLLITVLVVAIPVIAAERTVFDSGHAVDTIEDEDVYSRTTVAFQGRVTELVGEAPTNSSQQSAPLLDEQQRRQIGETAVSEPYVEAELRGHIDNAYSYLHGNREDVRFVFNLSEPKARAIEEATAVERDARAQQDPQITSPDAVPSDELVIGPYLSAEFPESQNITEAGAVPGELETARTAAAAVGILWWVLPVLAVLVVGLIYYVADRSVRKSAEATGGALVAAGLLTLIIGLGGRPIADSVAEGRLELENPAFDPLSDGLVALVGSLFDLVFVQSILLLGSGILVLGVVSAEANGFFDSLTDGDDSTARRERSQDSREQPRGRNDEGVQRYADEREVESELGGGPSSEESVVDSEDSVGTGDTRAVGSDEERPADSERPRNSEPESQSTPATDADEDYDPDQYDEHGFRVDDSSEEDSDERR